MSDTEANVMTERRTTDRDSVLDYLVARGVLSGDLTGARVTALTGGVSGEAVLVEHGHERVVVKRALGKLLVKDEWLAKRERNITEAAAIELVHAITPEYTPELLDIDPDRFTLTMAAASPRWAPWKTRLMNEPLDASVEIDLGRMLGTVLGTWHRVTSADGGVAARFNDYEAFEQLRVGPFHRVIARRHPDAAPNIEACIDDLLSRRDCFVHGDYSPKNILVGPATTVGPGGRDGLMVLDFEVAHVGAAVFDVAYLHCHLIMKAVHRPVLCHLFRQLAETFLDAYTDQTGAPPGPRLGSHVACLLLARVDGTSPSGYLTAVEDDVVRQLALDLLTGDEPSIDQVWDAALDAIAQADL
jgi:5-methylthioribose kinase